MIRLDFSLMLLMVKELAILKKGFLGSGRTRLLQNFKATTTKYRKEIVPPKMQLANHYGEKFKPSMKYSAGAL